jgi:membrane protease YdiL (CAAX protease family)
MEELVQALLYSVSVWLSAIVITSVFDRIVSFKRRPVSFSSPRKEAILSLCLLALTMAISVFINWVSTPLLETFEKEWPSSSLAYLAWKLFATGTAFAPFAVALLMRHQNLTTIGLSRHNLLPSVFLSIILSTVTVGAFVVAYGRFSNLMTFSYAHLHYLVALILSPGFLEEAIFRGHLQLRLTAWLGTKRAWILTAIVFTVGHFGQSIFGLISVFILALLFGWIMIKSENIVGLCIWHGFIDWVWILY